MKSEEKNSLDIEIYEFNFPIYMNDFIPPEGHKFTEDMFFDTIQRYNETLKGKILLDSYYKDETLENKMMDPSHVIRGIEEIDGQFYLKIGILRQSESGRMLRKFIIDNEIRMLIGLLWDIVDGNAAVCGIRFNFVKISKEKPNDRKLQIL